jgi:hypothetical protein
VNIFGYDTDKAWDYENGYYLTSHVTRMGKAIAQYELYKSIIGLPGQIVECGVFKGASLIRWATYREILESPHSRSIIGFDAFGQFPEQPDAADAAFASHWEKTCGEGISVGELNRLMAAKGIVNNIELIRGDIVETVEVYAKAHPWMKIALLHLDVDVYAPAMATLKALWDRIVPGGLLVMDDYGTLPGETRAVDEFFAGQSVEIQKLPLSHVPAYIRKI